MWVLYLWLDKNLENKKNREKKCFFRRRQRESCPRKFSSATFQLKQIAIVPQHRIPARFLFAANCALTECRVLMKLCKIIHISLHKKNRTFMYLTAISPAGRTPWNVSIDKELYQCQQIKTLENHVLHWCRLQLFIDRDRPADGKWRFRRRQRFINTLFLCN